MKFESQEMASPSLQEKEKEAAESLLKQKSFSLNGLSENLIPSNIKPGLWGENLGVIVFENESGIFASPASEETRELLKIAGYYQGGSIGVPHLNNAEIWSDAQKSPSGPFQEWKKIVEQGV